MVSMLMNTTAEIRVEEAKFLFKFHLEMSVITNKSVHHFHFSRTLSGSSLAKDLHATGCDSDNV